MYQVILVIVSLVTLTSASCFDRCFKFSRTPPSIEQQFSVLYADHEKPALAVFDVDGILPDRTSPSAAADGQVPIRTEEDILRAKTLIETLAQDMEVHVITSGFVKELKDFYGLIGVTLVAENGNVKVQDSGKSTRAESVVSRDTLNNRLGELALNKKCPINKSFEYSFGYVERYYPATHEQDKVNYVKQEIIKIGKRFDYELQHEEENYVEIRKMHFPKRAYVGRLLSGDTFSSGISISYGEMENGIHEAMNEMNGGKGSKLKFLSVILGDRKSAAKYRFSSLEELNNYCVQARQSIKS